MAKSGAPRGERSVKIGPYEVVKRIGAGGMGTVYLAKDSELGRNAKFYALTREGRKQLELELEIWKRLSSAVGLLLKRA